MTEQEATTIVAGLVDAFPRTTVTQRTADLYVGKIRPLDPELARKAADECMLGCRSFPTLNDFFTRYETVKQQAHRDSRERQRARDWEAADSLPKVPLNEIPSVVDYLGETQEQFGLVEVAAGPCADCRKDSPRRWRVGRIEVCGTHARSRVLAGFKAGTAA